MQTAAHGRFGDPDAVAHAVHQAARDSFRRPGCLKEPVHRILPGTFQDLRYLTSPRQAIDARLAREPLAQTNRLRTIPGIGPVFSAGILAEIPDIPGFPDDDQLAQLAGLTWPAYQSGPYTAAETPSPRLVMMNEAGPQFAKRG